MTSTSLVISLWNMKRGSGTGCFSEVLFHVIAKSDPANKAKIRLGFPEHVAVWDEWQNSEDERKFFQKYGVQIGHY